MLGDTLSFPLPVPVTGTHEDLVNSGNLRLIRNDNLRSLMAQFNDTLRTAGTLFEIALDTLHKVHMPYLAQYFVVSEFGWHASDDDLSAIDGNLTAIPSAT